MARNRPPATLAGIDYLQGFTAPQPTAATALRTAAQKIQSQAEGALAGQLPQEEPVTPPPVAPAQPPRIDLAQPFAPTAPSITMTPQQLTDGVSGAGVDLAGAPAAGLTGLPVAGGLSDLSGSQPSTAPTYDPTIPAPVAPAQQTVGAPVIGSDPNQFNMGEAQLAPQVPVAPQAAAPTGPTFQGQPLSDFLAGGTQLDPQGRMIDPDVDRSAFEQDSEARSMAAGNSIRPGVDVPSLAMQRARMDAGLDPVAGAPMGTEMSQQQQRDMLDRGFDPATGQKIGGDMTAQERANLAKTEAQIKTEQIRQAGMIQDIEQKGIKASEAKSEAEVQSISELTSYGEQINKLTGVRDEIAKLTGNRKTTEGGLGWLNAKLPLGSNARSVARLVKEIEGSTFIRGIIDAKNRGATFGPLSDQEGANIVAAYGKILEPDMKNEDRIRAINELLGATNAGFSGATDRHKAKYGGSGQKSESKPTGGTIPNVEGVTIKIKG